MSSAFSAAPAHDVVQHFLLDVHDVQPALRAELWRYVQRLQAGARAEFQHPLPGPGLQDLVQVRLGQERQLQVQQSALGVGVGRLIGEPPGARRQGGQPGRGGQAGAARGQVGCGVGQGHLCSSCVSVPAVSVADGNG
jgi:hypothetical protein